MAGPEKQRTKFNQRTKAAVLANEGLGVSRYSPLTLLGKAINRGVGAVASLTGNKRTARSVSQGIKAAKIKDKQGKLKYKTSWYNPALKARGIHGIPAPFASELNKLYKKK